MKFISILINLSLILVVSCDENSADDDISNPTDIIDEDEEFLNFELGDQFEILYPDDGLTEEELGNNFFSKASTIFSTAFPRKKLVHSLKKIDLNLKSQKKLTLVIFFLIFLNFHSISRYSKGPLIYSK